MNESQRVCLLNQEAVERALSRMARELVEKNGGPANLVLMGIHRRGVQLAALLKAEIEKAERDRDSQRKPGHHVLPGRPHDHRAPPRHRGVGASPRRHRRNARW